MTLSPGLLAFAGMLTSLLALTTAAAVTLPSLPASTVAPLAVDKGQALYACAEIPERLVAYDKMAREHDQSVAAFLGQVAQKLSEWYDLLHPYESKPVEKGTFQPLSEGAGQISMVTDLAYDNSALLASEMDRILRSLDACSIQKK